VDPAKVVAVTEEIRTFSSGATRDTDEGKLDYEGFLSPVVWQRFAQYMHKHRLQSDGKLRAGDNWQNGMPRTEYVRSLFRHFMDLWMAYRRGLDMAEPLCAMLFNVQGLLHEIMIGRSLDR
jgi:hypothetical protein